MRGDVLDSVGDDSPTARCAQLLSLAGGGWNQGSGKPADSERGFADEELYFDLPLIRQQHSPNDSSQAVHRSIHYELKRVLVNDGAIDKNTGGHPKLPVLFSGVALQDE